MRCSSRSMTATAFQFLGVRVISGPKRADHYRPIRNVQHQAQSHHREVFQLDRMASRQFGAFSTMFQNPKCSFEDDDSEADTSFAGGERRVHRPANP